MRNGRACRVVVTTAIGLGDDDKFSIQSPFLGKEPRSSDPLIACKLDLANKNSIFGICPMIWYNSVRYTIAENGPDNGAYLKMAFTSTEPPAGATAGLCVDVTLFPIDTIKTRLQCSQNGVKPTADRLRLFAGIPAVITGSAPGGSFGAPTLASTAIAACTAEVVACLVRVPCEVLKQRTQISPTTSVIQNFWHTLRVEGTMGLYRGYFSTLVREIPFSVIQYPIWENLKHATVLWNQTRNTPQPTELSGWQSAFCGCLAGGISGALTTPFDVAKTRIMVAETNSPLASGNIILALRTIMHEGGVKGLFAGTIPRFAYLSIGGAIFLGIYEIASRFWAKKFRPVRKIMVMTINAVSHLFWSSQKQWSKMVLPTTLK